MDKIFFIIVLVFLTSCQNEVDVNMDNQGLPVAYCILNMDDTLQYVRLAKSFFPEKDYLQHEHITIEQWDEPVDIYLEEWDKTGQPAIYNFHPAGTIRQDTGYFANPSFKLFEISMKPTINTLYYMYLWFPERNYYAYASTISIGNTEIVNPANIPGRTITFSDVDEYVVELRPEPHAEFHQFNFILTIEEYLESGFQLDYFTYGGQVYEENNGQILMYLLNSDRFYTNLLARYDSLSGTDFRSISGVEFTVNSFGSELRLYNQLYNNGSKPWEIQSYSSFTNGFGLFSSSAKSRVTNLELSKLTYQILTGDSRYKHLKFVR